MGDDATNVERAKDYKTKVSAELCSICDTVATVLNEAILPATGASNDHEAMSFYCKMLGDYYRYKAEFAREDKKNEIIPLAQEAYTTGTAWAEHLGAAHPIRLGLALNLSVFEHEVCRQTDQAIQTATVAFQDAQRVEG